MPSQEPNISEQLTAHLLFSRLSNEHLEQVAHAAARLNLDEHEILFEQGSPADRFYLLLTGQIKLSRLSPDGGEKIIEIITPGHTFAEALLFLDHPIYPVTATALQAARLISVDARDFASVLRQSMDTCFLIMGDMSQRLRSLVQEIDDLTLQSAMARVASYLLHHAAEDNGAFVLEIPKQVLAARLSVTPETFSRILRRLSDQNIIEVDRQLVRIIDREGLMTASHAT